MASAAQLDYYLVLDFEATCDQKDPPRPQEIIEFPVLKVNSRTMQTEAVFHTYVMPTAHPNLTPFCTELTGITNNMIKHSPYLRRALENFHEWMNGNGLLQNGVSFSFVTCSDWDLKTMLPRQCKHFHIPVRNYFHRWINIQDVFAKLTDFDTQGKPTSLTKMLKHFELTMDGRQHSGIDDAKNIAKVLTKLAEINPNIQPTMTLPSYVSSLY